MPGDMIEKKVKSAVPIYLAAGAFLACTLLFPIYRLWGLIIACAATVLTYVVADKRTPLRTVMVPAPAVVYATGEAGLDNTLAKAQKDLAVLHGLNERIPDPQLSAAITRMEKAGNSILEQAAKDPSKAKSIRKFVAYYLPTSISILTNYADMAAAGATGTNAQSVQQQVKQNADTIATAFEAQLDALFAGKALDVSADITVLDGMMKGDGLTGQDAVQQAAAADTTGMDAPSDIKPTLTL